MGIFGVADFSGSGFQDSDCAFEWTGKWNMTLQQIKGLLTNSLALARSSAYLHF